MTSTAQGFALFDTAIGTCGIAWGADGVVGVQLPEASAVQTRARLKRRFEGAPETSPPWAAQSAIDAMTGFLEGKPAELSGIPLDMRDVPRFRQRVYEVARTIPPGATLSYGEVAARLGEPAWPVARDVGQALAHNPFPIVVPCHRVVAARGKLGGFSARGGLTTKRRLLSIEIASLVTRSNALGHSTTAFNAPLFADVE
ncbi:MAG: methylated-DNA--[protein]-cysteine S-methyltransferase [Chloroflexota bacterium]|nr:methylated-DNA--[protein]-cysteine S-methyltransferase [Chloroflexota bacterium]